MDASSPVSVSSMRASVWACGDAAAAPVIPQRARQRPVLRDHMWCTAGGGRGMRGRHLVWAGGGAVTRLVEVGGVAGTVRASGILAAGPVGVQAARLAARELPPAVCVPPGRLLLPAADAANALSRVAGRQPEGGRCAVDDMPRGRPEGLRRDRGLRRGVAGPWARGSGRSWRCRTHRRRRSHCPGTTRNPRAPTAHARAPPSAHAGWRAMAARSLVGGGRWWVADVGWAAGGRTM